MSTPVLRLERVAAFNGLCVLGRLTTTGAHAHKPVAKTLERPWLDNKPFESSIPPGIFDVTPRETQKFGRHFAFNDSQTAPRYAILIHAGNRAKDTEGCILVGDTYFMLAGEPAVRSSRRALNDLLQAYPDGFTLHVEGFG